MTKLELAHHMNVLMYYIYDDAPYLHLVDRSVGIIQNKYGLEEFNTFMRLIFETLGKMTAGDEITLIE